MSFPALSCLVAAILLVVSVDEVVGGECCDAFYDKYRVHHDEQWCDSYCCDMSTSLFGGKDLRCCESSYLRARAADRDDVCGIWWSEHAWAPALIGIAILAAVAGCIACCIKGCCCNRPRPGNVIVPQPQRQIVVMSAQQQSAQATGTYGYGADPQQATGNYGYGAGPAYPPAAYPSGDLPPKY